MNWPRFKRIVRALNHFSAPEHMLPTAQDMDLMVNERGRGTRLLGFYSPEDVIEALQRYGLASKLSGRGFTDPGVEIETSERDRQLVRVTGVKQGTRHMLGEAILRDDLLVSREPYAGVLTDVPVRMLFVQWIRLQDPTVGFTPDRPPLPGQLHPGLGVGREVMTMFGGLADRLGFSGIMVCPEFAHNAVLYSREFRFFDPCAQGRFEALAQILDRVTLAELAWGVQAGCVVDEVKGETFRWFHEEMLRAASGRVIDYLRSRDYAARVAAARRSSRYRLDGEKLRELALPPSEPHP